MKKNAGKHANTSKQVKTGKKRRASPLKRNETQKKKFRQLKVGGENRSRKAIEAALVNAEKKVAETTRRAAEAKEHYDKGMEMLRSAENRGYVAIDRRHKEQRKRNSSGSESKKGNDSINFSPPLPPNHNWVNTLYFGIGFGIITGGVILGTSH